MHQNDLLRLQSCSAKELERVAHAYGIAPTGARGIYGLRRQTTHTGTGRVMILKRSLKTTDLRDAVLKGVPIVEEWLVQVQSASAPAITADAGKPASLDELTDAYMLVSLVKANAVTRKRNAASLRAVLREAWGDLGPTPTTALITREAAQRFQDARKAAALKEPDLLRRDAMIRSANNTLKQAQSVVCRAALDDMHRLRLNVADLRAFNERARIPVDRAPEPEALPDDLVARLRAEVEALRTGVVTVTVSGTGGEAKRVQVPGVAVWAAFQLMVWGGLRNVEVAHARLDWIEDRNGAPWLGLVKTAEWQPKGNGREVPLPATVVAELRALERAEGDTHIVPARTPTERALVCWRGVNAWLASLGVEREAGKVAYRLRKYFLNRIKEETLRQMHAIAAAASAAGHTGVETTMGSYVGRPKMTAPVSLPGA